MPGIVKHRATPRFWKCYDALSSKLQQRANRCFELLRDNPRHPSLHLKRVGEFWSVRIGLHFRALAVEHENDLLWFWIGSHAEYDQLTGTK